MIWIVTVGDHSYCINHLASVFFLVRIGPTVKSPKLGLIPNVFMSILNLSRGIMLILCKPLSISTGRNFTSLTTTTFDTDQWNCDFNPNLFSSDFTEYGRLGSDWLVKFHIFSGLIQNLMVSCVWNNWRDVDKGICLVSPCFTFPEVSLFLNRCIRCVTDVFFLPGMFCTLWTCTTTALTMLWPNSRNSSCTTKSKRRWSKQTSLGCDIDFLFPEFALTDTWT